MVPPLKFLFCITFILCLSYGNGSVVDLSNIFDTISNEYFTDEFFEQAFVEKADENKNEIEKRENHDRIADQFDITSNDELFPLLSTSLGNIRGKVMKSYFQQPFYAFQGIPYAKPLNKYFQMSEISINKLAEEPEEYDATYFRAKCPQASMITGGTAGSLDCLHLSIYTPATILEDLILYPVMVFIHGGAFISGDASLYIPTKLLDKDVIVVVLQYRLGSLGFLCGGTSDAPGNMGLMDQIIALRWIQTHIRDFGGDRFKITVFGQSAGAASASWMMFSPLTGKEYNNDNLVHRVLAQSGSANEVWALDPNPEESFYIHAKAVDCDVTATKSQIIRCMENKDIDTIVNGFNFVYADDRAHGGLGFKGLSPVIQGFNDPYFEENLSNEIRVIIEHPLISAKNGNHLEVEIMTGSVRDEGSLVAGLAWDSFFGPKNLTYNETFMSTEVLPFFVHAFGIPDVTETVANSIRLAFLRDAQMGNWNSMIGGLIDAFGMMFLKSGGWTLASVISNRSPEMKGIYFYSFEFESNDSIFDWYFISEPDIPMNGGITHADDLLYLFHMPSYMNDDENQLQTIRRMTTLWANFAKYGNPTQPQVTNEKEKWQNLVDEWEPFTYENKKFMLIQDECHMAVDFTLRWNFNSIGEGSGVYNDSMSSEEQTITTDQEIQGNVAIIALSVTCSVMMLCIVALVFKMLRP